MLTELRHVLHAAQKTGYDIEKVPDFNVCAVLYLMTNVPAAALYVHLPSR